MIIMYPIDIKHFTPLQKHFKNSVLWMQENLSTLTGIQPLPNGSFRLLTAHLIAFDQVLWHMNIKKRMTSAGWALVFICPCPNPTKKNITSRNKQNNKMCFCFRKNTFSGINCNDIFYHRWYAQTALLLLPLSQKVVCTVKYQWTVTLSEPLCISKRVQFHLWLN